MTRPSLEGSLTKWTNVMKGWQHRWFVLDENAGLLSYYTSREKMMRGVRRGCVRLKGAILGIDNEEDCNFTITTDSKTFHFQARDSSEREVWVRALEDTILRHAPFPHEHQVQPIIVLRKHMPHHLLKVHFEGDESMYETNMKKFDNRISQADVLLQILIEQTQSLEHRIPSIADDSLKMRLQRIAKNYNSMLEAVKLAIVMLQILKNTIDPIKGIGLVTSSSSKSKKALRGSSGRRGEAEAVARSSFPDQAISATASQPPSQPPGDDAPPPPPELGAECLESRRLVHAAVIENLPNVPTNAAMTLIVSPDIVPETSYSSSDDDDDFFDADEELLSPTPKVPAIPIFTAYLDHDHEAFSATQSDGLKNDAPSTSKKTQRSTSPPVIRQDGTLDYDALYEDDEDQSDISMENHGTIITHLLSQVKIGMDLTKVVLPTFILETRSLLEMYADYFAHPDLFVGIATKKTPRDRMLQVVKWYLSAYHAGRKSAVAKKPYNPILGEVFQCHWDVPEACTYTTDQDPGLVPEGPVPWCSTDQLTFVAEQVSHHPPVSAFYAEHVTNRICFCAFVYTKSKFLGLSVGVQNIGHGTVYVMDYNEEYVVTFPNGYGRSILTTPWVELGGVVNVTCKKTGYHASIEFHTKPFYGGKKHRITGEVFAPGEKKPFVTVQGEWNGLMECRWMDSMRTEVLVDVTKMQVTKKNVRKVAEQEANESRSLWKEVTAGLRLNDIEKATNAKTFLEQKQRDEAKIRKETCQEWKTKLFYERTEGDWYYKFPLTKRLSESAVSSQQDVREEDR